MQISLILMEEIAKLFLIMFMGYALVKTGLLKTQESKVVSVILVYLVIPCMIIHAFQINDSPQVRVGLMFALRQRQWFTHYFCFLQRFCADHVV